MFPTYKYIFSKRDLSSLALVSAYFSPIEKILFIYRCERLLNKQSDCIIIFLSQVTLKML